MKRPLCKLCGTEESMRVVIGGGLFAIIVIIWLMVAR